MDVRGTALDRLPGGRGNGVAGASVRARHVWCVAALAAWAVLGWSAAAMATAAPAAVEGQAEPSAPPVAPEKGFVAKTLDSVNGYLWGWPMVVLLPGTHLLGKRVIKPYRLAWVAAVMLGAVTQLSTVWAFADAANALMALPNLVALILLSGVIVKETRHYLWSGRLEEGTDGTEEQGQEGRV